jgi:hypothetical protein
MAILAEAADLISGAPLPSESHGLSRQRLSPQLKVGVGGPTRSSGTKHWRLSRCVAPDGSHGCALWSLPSIICGDSPPVGVIGPVKLVSRTSHERQGAQARA